MVTVTLSHSLSESTVATLGLPAGDYRSGQQITVDPGVAERLIRAGYTTVNPENLAAVNAALLGGAGITPGAWYVDAGRLLVDLAAVAAANRTPSVDIYRISRNSNGVFTHALWALAGQQIPANAMTAAQGEALTSVPAEPLAAAGGTSGAQIAAAVSSAINAQRESPSGLAGLTSAGKLVESRLPDRLSSASLTTASDDDRDRANHTGSSVDPITTAFPDFIERVQDTVATLLYAGAGVTLAYDDTLGRLTVTTTGGGGTGTVDPEGVRDTVAAALVAGTGIGIAVDDVADTITLSVSGLTIANVASLQTTLNAKADLVGGVIPTAQIPAIAITEVFTVATQAAMLALTAQRGDVAIRTDTGRRFILTTDAPGTLANWVDITAADTVVSVNGQAGVVVLGKADVGLGNVDNTSDANKPVSTAQNTAIAAAVAPINTLLGSDADGAYTSVTARLAAIETNVANAASAETMTSAPAGSVFAKMCSGGTATTSGTWPTRGSTRTDIVVAWMSRAAGDTAPPQGGTGAIGDDYWMKIDA